MADAIGWLAALPADSGAPSSLSAWSTVAKAGGTCDRTPLAISPDRCVNAKWCYTGCVFGAKNSVITNYLASAERAARRYAG